jgi:hypothetical protein
MTSYAKGTTVDPARTRNEIEHELERRGATAFGYNRDGRRNVVAFTLDGLQVRMELPMPDPGDFPDYKAGNNAVVSGQKRYDQEVRRRWRALLLVVKAKLVAVDDGITSLEREFLADVVLPGGATVLEEVRPAIESARATLATRGEVRQLPRPSSRGV